MITAWTILCRSRWIGMFSHFLGDTLLLGNASGDSSSTSSLYSASSNLNSASSGGLKQSLQEMAEAFQKGVEVKDHRYHMKVSYPNTFVGSDAVDIFVVSGIMAKSRRKVVELGHWLASKYNLLNMSTKIMNSKTTIYFMFFATSKRLTEINATGRDC